MVAEGKKTRRRLKGWLTRLLPANADAYNPDSYATPDFRAWFASGVTVLPSGCHRWFNSGDNRYGVVAFPGARRGAHCVALELALGRSVVRGLDVLHSCDNRYCVNPDHLREGTAADNMRDREERGRANRGVGENAPRARLTDEQVREIRAACDAGQSRASVARQYGIDYRYVFKLWRGKMRGAA